MFLPRQGPGRAGFHARGRGTGQSIPWSLSEGHPDPNVEPTAVIGHAEGLPEPGGDLYAKSATDAFLTFINEQIVLEYP